jgi:tRNA(fMet)-specific endonuclease VapC
MNLMFDTNMILAIGRDKSGHRIMEYLNPKEEAVYVSFVNIAEAQSIAFQNKWGASKMRILEDFFDSVRIIDISDLLLPTYIGIDAYSQRNHPDYEFYPFPTPRNMGKNDLWTVRRIDCSNRFIIKPKTYYDRWRF